jgi:hypothetical protein
MSKYWFKPKSYGYGFFPVSWEGWLCTFGLVVIILLSGFSNDIFTEIEPSPQNAVRFLLDIFIFAALATYLFEKKMKEPLKWRWGRRK